MRVRPLHDDLGAEVLDFDLLAPTPPEVVEELQQAFDDYQFLLFRPGRPVPAERHGEFVSIFGTHIDTTGGKTWGTMDNQISAGSARLPFHSDHTYSDTPVKAISLHALELPPGGSGTSFVSGMSAWAALTPELQERLAEMTAQHTHTSKYSDEFMNEPTYFEALHPVRYLHPRTGRPILFLTEWHADNIRGLDREESDAVLSEIFEGMYSPEHIYTHSWELYDFIVWDNLALQHARSDSSLTEGRRLLQRVALNDVSYEEIIAKARDDQQRRKSLQTA